MQPTHKLIILLEVLTIAVGLALWYLTIQTLPEITPAPEASIEPASISHYVSQPTPTSPPINTQLQPAEKLPIFYLGEPIALSKEKQATAARLLADHTRRNPNHFGIITEDSAPNEIKIILQHTATSLANVSAIDLACESIVNDQAPCSQIQSQYQRAHEGFPSHAQIFPPQDGYTCDTIRKAISPVLAFHHQQCSTLSDQALQVACQDLPASCTPNLKSAPCDLMLGFAKALTSNQPCTQGLNGQRAYLCDGVKANDCTVAYRRMIEDYTYTELGISTHENGFCELVEDATLRHECISGDKDAVRKDLMRSYID